MMLDNMQKWPKGSAAEQKLIFRGGNNVFRVDIVILLV